MTLQRAQFAQMADSLGEPDGGYSIDVKTGKPARKGYMVSHSGMGQSFPAGHEVTPGEIQLHATRHAAVLAQPAQYAGGWHDPDSGVKDLDVSQRYASHDRARNAMVADDEKALYNSHEWHSERNYLGHGLDFSTSPNPDNHVLGNHLTRGLSDSTARGLGIRYFPMGVRPMAAGGYEMLRRASRANPGAKASDY